jgi:hypothetical protein
MLHADNPRPRKAAVSQQILAQNGIEIAAHHPYSPDLTPSNFYPFRHVKGVLRDESFETGTIVPPRNSLPKSDFSNGLASDDGEKIRLMIRGAEPFRFLIKLDF